MQSRSFSAMLQELSSNYYNHLISFQDFRGKRREILDQIDAYYNGADTDAPEPRPQGDEDPYSSTLSFASFEAMENSDKNDKED